MNERINQLAEQAKAETYDHFNGQTFEHGAWNKFFEAKFAELIVEECAMVAYRKGFCQECGGGEYISSDIRKHFRS